MRKSPVVRLNNRERHFPGNNLGKHSRVTIDDIDPNAFKALHSRVSDYDDAKH